MAGKRKYKYSDMGEDGWPVGLKPKAIHVLSVIEVGFWTIREIREKTRMGIKPLVTTIGRLIEKRIVVKRVRVKDAAVYSLSERIQNMRRDFASKKTT
jgi:hypothetical protein